MLLKIGDVDTDEDINKKISPLFHVDNIRAPRSVVQIRMGKLCESCRNP